MEEDVRSDVQVGLLCILAFLGVGTNSFIFILFYSRRSVRTFSNRFVLSLASSHILQCIVIIPAFGVPVREWGLGDAWCKATTSLTICLNLTSVLSILLIAVDRNCAVNSPLHYNVTITKRRTGLLICGIWTLSAALAAPTLFGVPQLEYSGSELAASPWSLLRTVSLAYTAVLGVLGFVVPFFSVACLYFAMFRAAETNNARARRRNSSNSCLSSELVVNLKPPKKLGVNEYSLRRNFSSERSSESSGSSHLCCCVGKHKAAVTGLLVVMSFVVCWLPYFSTLLLQQFQLVTSDVKFCVHFATFLSCTLNPYVYFFRNKNTWKQSKKLLSRLLNASGKELPHPTTRKGRIDASTRGVFRLPLSLSQTVLSTQEPVVCPLSSNSVPEDNSHRPATLAQQLASRTRKPGIFSVDPAKPLLHQDSSSSNDSSDMGVTTVMIGSTLSIDEAASWYQAYHQRYSEDSMTEIPLGDAAAI